MVEQLKSSKVQGLNLKRAENTNIKIVFSRRNIHHNIIVVQKTIHTISHER